MDDSVFEEPIRTSADVLQLWTRLMGRDGLRSDAVVSDVLLLLSRPGDHAMTPSDRAWARALTASIAAAHGGWPVHLATADHVRVFAADDLIATR